MSNPAAVRASWPGRCRAALTLLSLLLTLLVAPGAGAQDVEEGFGRLRAWGRSVVSTDDTTALVVNPATLAFLPGEELRWTSTYLQERAEPLYQGHSVAFGLPISLLRLSTGLRVDFVDPPGDEYEFIAPVDYNYQWVTWGLAFRGGDAAALGLSVQRSYGEAAVARGLSSWSLGFVSRPYDTFGLGFVANHINGPRNAVGGFVRRSYDLGLALRPWGTRTAELGFEARYVDVPSGFWVPKITLGLDIPPLGRLRGDFAISDPTDDIWEGRLSRNSWIASLALAIYLNTPTGSLEAAAGSLVGTRLGEDVKYNAHHNVQTELALKTWSEPVGPKTPRYALRVRMEATPNARKHVRLLRTLWRLADDSTLDGVLLELRAAPASSLAHAQELRDALEQLRRQGKRVMCHLEDARGLALYVCAAANRILMNPAGGLRFAGLRTKTFYYKKLLDKLGIRADFVRIGPHKSAPESFMRESGSRIARKDKIDLLQQYERQVMAGIAAGRNLSVAEVRKRIAKGPFVASEALAQGLIDGFAFDDQLEEKLFELMGREVVVIDEPGRRAPLSYGSARRITLVYATGNLIDGRSRTIPLLDLKLLGSYSLAETLKQVREDPKTAAVVLRIDSPGGSAMASDVIWREVQLTARFKPVIVSMGSVAASGGYYIAAPATHIFANPLTLTGSIGIYYGKADIAQLMKKIGVSVEVYKTAPRADAESIFRPFTPDERRELKRKVRQFYETFLTRVARPLGRDLSKEEVRKVAEGRVWTGEQAHARQLVDELGGLRQALDYARRVADLPDYAPIVELPPPRRTLLGLVLGVEGVHAEAKSGHLPPQFVDVVRALAPFVVYPGDKPLALMELTQVGP